MFFSFCRSTTWSLNALLDQHNDLSLFYIDVYNVRAHNSSYNHFHYTVCHNSKAAPDGKWAIFYFNNFLLPISKYLMPVYYTKCILILNFAGLGLICSEVCFWCLWTCSYRCLDLFGLNLLFWSREWWWSGTEIIRLLNTHWFIIFLFFLPLLPSFHSIILCRFTLDWYWFCLFKHSTTVKPKVYGSRQTSICTLRCCIKFAVRWFCYDNVTILRIYTLPLIKRK